jgi:hypothetical protein
MSGAFTFTESIYCRNYCTDAEGDVHKVVQVNNICAGLKTAYMSTNIEMGESGMVYV